MGSRSKSQRRARNARRGQQRTRPTKPWTEPVLRRSRPGLIAFWVVALLAYAALVIWPLAAGETVLTWTAVGAGPVLIAFAYAMVYRDVRGTTSDPFGGS